MVVLLIGFGIWFVLSVANQFNNPIWSRIGRWDRFALLPRWTFFAPKPGTKDTRIVFRDIAENGALGGWRELDLYQDPGHLSWIWNPNKFAVKSLSDVCQTLFRSARMPRV
jgi:hypothetical protein